MNQKELLEIFFPEEINWNRFNLIEVKEKQQNNIAPYKWVLEFIIQEKNIVPNNANNSNNSNSLYKWQQYISKWFFPPKTITDFPVRNKLAKIILIRRRWINKETKEYLKSDLDLNYNGTRTTFTLMDFLKWHSR